MSLIGDIPYCSPCNDTGGEYFRASSPAGAHLSSSIDAYGVEANKVLIECFGATLYHPDTNDVSTGVKFVDHGDPTKGLKIVSRPVYGPDHVKNRWVKIEDAHLIRRCQSCQDHTIRMRRKEGPDLYIPPRRHSIRLTRSNRASELPQRNDQKAASPESIFVESSI